MKRFIALIIVVSIISLAAFGTNPSAEFTVGTFVDEVAGVIVHDNDTIPGVTYPTDHSSWISLSPVGTTVDPVWLVQDQGGVSQGSFRVLAVSVRTNQAGDYTLKATAGPMVTPPPLTGAVGYKVKVGQTETAIGKTDQPKTIDLMTVNVASGLVYKTQEFRVEINDTDYQNAISGNYSSTWTIELIAGT